LYTERDDYIQTYDFNIKMYRTGYIWQYQIIVVSLHGALYYRDPLGLEHHNKDTEYIWDHQI